MPSHGDPKDLQAIEALIERQFASLTWTQGETGNWGAFSADFLAGAQLYPAARPVKCQSVSDFVQRMQGLAGSKLRTFTQKLVGGEIRVFGNAALAVAVNEITENDAQTSRAVEMLLLVREGGAWRIAAQAWDTAVPAKPIAKDLSGR